MNEKREGNQDEGTGVRDGKNRRTNCDSELQKEVRGRNISRRESIWEPWDPFTGQQLLLEKKLYSHNTKQLPCHLSKKCPPIVRALDVAVNFKLPFPVERAVSEFKIALSC